MWVLIFWMSSPFAMTLSDAQQPTIAIHTQGFTTEQACKSAFQAIKKLNDRDFTLRGVCAPKE
ncbi:hypothetical protein AV650_15300 [Serratia fonticola]|nr:hypothetical protein AV650_15300 [Serratia fonticola]